MPRNADVKQPKPGTCFRPEIETLEDRLLLSGSSFVDRPIVPDFTPSLLFNMRGILGHGQQVGNRPSVFIRVGDSNSVLPGYLSPLGNPSYNPNNPVFAGAYTELASTINYFRFLPIDASFANSFTHTGKAAVVGWTTAQELSPLFNFPLLQEIVQSRPQFALIMLGTNDLVVDPNPESFRTRLSEIVSTIASAGVIPILSTIPDNYYAGGVFEPRVLLFNQVISEVADVFQAPLWNFWRALQSLPGHGMIVDSFHLNVHPLSGGLFTPEGLQFGFNERNLTAVQVLNQLQNALLSPVDSCLQESLTPQTTAYVKSLYVNILGRQADANGLNAWGHLYQCGYWSMQQVATRVWQSAEHRAQQVNHYYVTLLGRTPLPNEQALWVNQFVVGASEESVQLGILASTEYQSAHRDDSSFIQSLYVNILGRMPEASAPSDWTAKLKLGLSRHDAALGFLTSAEYDQVLLYNYYGQILHRPAAANGIAAWVVSMQQNHFSMELTAEFLLASTEFQEKA